MYNREEKLNKARPLKKFVAMEEWSVEGMGFVADKEM